VTSLYKGSKSKTTEMFKEELKSTGRNVIILGEYVSAKTNIACQCPACNYCWETTPNRLLSAGSGCPKCGGRVLPTIEDINAKLEVQDKSFVVSGQLNKSTDKLSATCSNCGDSWEGCYGTFLRDGYSCTTCRKKHNSNPSEEVQLELNQRFQARLNALDKNFTLVGNYTRTYKPVTVSCNSCGRAWTNTAFGVLTNGCAECSGKVKGSLEKTQQVLKQSGRQIKVSGNYHNAFSKLSCECLVCSTEWLCHSHNLLNGGRGCPSCAKTGYDPSKAGILYYLRVSDENTVYWKIGITNLSVKERFPSVDREKIVVLYSQKFDDGNVAQKAERNILNIFKEYRAQGLDILKSGNTELFTHDVLQMDHLGGDV